MNFERKTEWEGERERGRVSSKVNGWKESEGSKSEKKIREGEREREQLKWFVCIFSQNETYQIAMETNESIQNN